VSIFERLAAGPDGLKPGDYDDWNQMVGAAPPERFGRATTEAIRQVEPQEYYRHTQPGVDGTDPLGALQPERRAGLVQTLLGELARRGLGQREVGRDAALRTLDPQRMSSEDVAALAQWIQREHPEAFGRVAAQYKDEPDLLSSLLGNKALMGAVAALGAQVLAGQLKGRR
jgi:hypothetical protein